MAEQAECAALVQELREQVHPVEALVQALRGQVQPVGVQVPVWAQAQVLELVRAAVKVQDAVPDLQE